MAFVVMVLAWLITKAIHDGRIDHTLAKQGMISPRLQAKYGPDAASFTAGWGLMAFLRDTTRDYLGHRAEAIRAARAAKAAGEDPKAAAVRAAGTQPGTPPEVRPSTTPNPVDEPGAPEPPVTTPPAHTPTPASAGSPAPGGTGPVNGGALAPSPRHAAGTPPTRVTGVAPPPPTNPGLGTAGWTDRYVHAVQHEPMDAVAALEDRIEAAGQWEAVQAELRRRQAAGTLPFTIQRPPSTADDPAQQVGPHNTPNNQEEPVTTPTPTLPTVPTGDADTVPQLVTQAQAIKLHTLALKESLTASVADLARTVETLDTSAAGINMPPPVTNGISGAREAVASLVASLNGVTEEVSAAMTVVEAEAAKHLTVVEQKAALGGLATSSAY